MAGQQALKGTSVTVTETFSVDGVPTDLDSGVPTVVAKYPDGSALTPAPVASGSWSTPTPRTTGQYRIVLDGQAEVTYLDPVTWTGTIGGKTQVLYSRVEWVGGLLFTLSELRGLKVGNGYPFAEGAVPPFSTQRLMDARVVVTEEFRTILGFHPVPRFCRETRDGDGRASVVLTDPGLKATKLLSVTVDGATKTVADYTLKPSGILLATSNYRYSGYFPDGVANVTVEYVSGLERIEDREGRHAAMAWAAKFLDPSGFSSAQTVTTPDGMSYTYEPSETGRGGFMRWTGIRDLDRWLNRTAGGGVAVA